MDERNRISRIIEVQQRINELEYKLEHSDGRTALAKTRKERLANLKAQLADLQKDGDAKQIAASTSETKPEPYAPDKLPKKTDGTDEQDSKGDAK